MMRKEMVTIEIPILFTQNGKYALCPHFKSWFTIEPTMNLKESVVPEAPTIIDIELPDTYKNLTLTGSSQQRVANMGLLVEKLCSQIEKEYADNHDLRPPSNVDAYKHIRLEPGDLWLTYSLQMEIQKGKFEKYLPIFFISAAIIYQTLSICNAGISIYVKGLSIPVTLSLSLSSAAVAMINFTQADAMPNVAKLGRYLDHVSPKRCVSNIGQGIADIKNHKLLIGTGLVFSAIVVGAIVGDATSAFSQTEIIDTAGYNKGLTFLVEDVIFIHALIIAICGCIAYGTFGGNFAMKAVTRLTNWIHSKAGYQTGENTSEHTKEEQLSLLTKI